MAVTVPQFEIISGVCSLVVFADCEPSHRNRLGSSSCSGWLVDGKLISTNAAHGHAICVLSGHCTYLISDDFSTNDDLVRNPRNMF